MTTTQEDDIQPTHLIHWLYEDSLIFEVHQAHISHMAKKLSQ